MAIRPNLRNSWTIEFSGLDMETSKKSEWRAAATKVARALQELLSESFSNEMTKGKYRLRPNSAAWNAYKARMGLDPRRGHASNNLQRTLDRRVLFSVSAVNAGRVTITFREEWLRNWVPYAEYYASTPHNKVRGGRILVVTREWVRQAMGPMLAQQAEGQMRATRARARLAPLAARPTRIKPAIGLTNKLANQIAKQAQLLKRTARRIG